MKEASRVPYTPLLNSTQAPHWVGNSASSRQTPDDSSSTGRNESDTDHVSGGD